MTERGQLKKQFRTTKSKLGVNYNTAKGQLKSTLRIPRGPLEDWGLGDK